MKKTILLLDDKESIAKVVAVYLSGEYDVVYFDNALKGIQWLQEGNKPDLIISDIRMPVMRGDEFLEYVKNNEPVQIFPCDYSVERGKHLRTDTPAGSGRFRLYRQTV